MKLILIKEQSIVYKKTIKVCALFLYTLMFSACNKNIDYYNIPTFSLNKNLNAVIEIPAGTNKKFEYNKDTKTFEIDKREDAILNVPNISKWFNNGLTLSKANTTNYKLTRKEINKASFIRIRDIDVYEGDLYEVSVLAKKSGNADFIGLRLQSKYPNRVDAVFNLKKGTITGIKRIGSFEDQTATITPLNNGWYKCTIKARIYSEQLNVLMGPTDGSKGITNWEGPNKIKSSVLIDPKKITIKSTRN